MSDFRNPGDHVHQHVAPARRERSDWIVQYRLEDDEDGTRRYEQLWAKRVSPSTFELCCIPFFAYGLALGDLIEMRPDHLLLRVVKESGELTFRVWTKESNLPDAMTDLLRHFHEFQLEHEQYSEHYVALSAPPERHMEVADFLRAGQEAGCWVYETGRAN